jgi:hypothetical protein
MYDEEVIRLAELFGDEVEADYFMDRRKKREHKSQRPSNMKKLHIPELCVACQRGKCVSKLKKWPGGKKGRKITPK